MDRNTRCRNQTGSGSRVRNLQLSMEAANTLKFAGGGNSVMNLDGSDFGTVLGPEYGPRPGHLSLRLRQAGAAGDIGLL